MTRIAGQLLAYAAFGAVVAVFSVWPRYRMLESDKSLISITFSHAAERIGECRVLSQQELDELPPNMRKPSDCPRERHAVYIELRSNDAVIFSDLLLPSGLWQDGKVNVYHRVQVEAGLKRLFIGMNDSGAEAGFDYTLNEELMIRPGQNLVIGFDGLSRAFVIY